MAVGGGLGIEVGVGVGVVCVAVAVAAVAVEVAVAVAAAATTRRVEATAIQTDPHDHLMQGPGSGEETGSQSWRAQNYEVTAGSLSA